MELKNKKVTRQLQADIQQENSQVVFSFATQTPYLRENQLGQYYEILKCEPQYVDTSRLKDGGCQLLLDHNWERTVGVCKKYWFENKKLYASCAFSKSNFAQGIKRDVLDLIRRNVSLGYIVKDYQVVNPIDGIKTIEVTDWEPYQFSIVSVPADVNAGYLRSMEDSQKGAEMKNEQINKTDSNVELAKQNLETKSTDVELENKDLAGEGLEKEAEVAKEEGKETEETKVKSEVCPECGKDPCECKQMDDTDETEEDSKDDSTEEKDCGGKPQEKELSVNAITQVKTIEDGCNLDVKELKLNLPQESTVSQINTDAEQIRELGQIYEDREAAIEFIAAKKSLNDFKNYLKNKGSEQSKNSIQDENKMDRKYFSIVKAIRNAGNLNKGDISQDYETQVVNENKRKLNITDADIVLTTTELYNRALGPTSGKGAELIATDYLPQEFVPFDRPQLTIDKVGSYSIPSDGNPVSFAQCVSGATAAMYGLDGELSAGDMDFVLKTLTPHKAGVNIPIPYSLLLEGRPDIDSMVQADVVNALYQKRDEQVWTGTGANNQVAGIETLTGINIISSGTSLSAGQAWGAMLSAIGAIRKKNIFSENISFVMNTDTWVVLKKTMKDANNAYGGWIIEDDKIGGYPVYVNNAISANTVLVGCGEYIAVSDFKGIGILVDPYTYSNKQALKVTAWASFDMVLRNLGAWTKVTLTA